MTIGTFLSTFAALLGFGASIFFVIGSVRLSKEAIFELATPYYDYHSGIAKTFAEQKWFYIFGAVLLVLGFIAQTISLLPFESNFSVTSMSPVTGLVIAGTTTAGVWVASYLLSKHMVNITVQTVDKMSNDQIAADEEELASKNVAKSH
jgi:hypothetical protein